MAPFEGFDLSDFWEETSNYAKDKYIGPVPTDEMIRSVEEDQYPHQLGGGPYCHREFSQHRPGQDVFPLRQNGQPVYD